MTYGKLPSRIPQDLQRALVGEDGIELVSEDPAWHCDYCVVWLHNLISKPSPILALRLYMGEGACLPSNAMHPATDFPFG
jgi:hypothetical protein